MAEGDRGGSHPSPAELDRFLLGELSPLQAAPIVAHLVRGCAVCRERTAPLASVVFANGPLAPPPSSHPGSEYDFPLFKAFAAARHYVESRALGMTDAPRRPGKPFPKVVPAPAASKGDRDSRKRCEALLKRCRCLRFSDPEGMILAASLAVSLAERMDAGQVGPGELADLQARAWAELGNAHRVADDLASAEPALARAQDLSGYGTGDPMLLARILDLTASLFTDQRRFGEAHRLLDWTYAIYQRVGDSHAAGRALISKGNLARAALQPEEGLRLLTQGIRQIDAAHDPKLVFVAVHGLLGCLVDCGRMTEAKALLTASQGLYSTYGERLDAPRVRWLEGQISAGCGENERAEQLLRQARKGFERADLPYDTALVSLDLAAVWLRQGRTAEIAALVDEMVAIFRVRNIQREAIGALLMLREALQKDRATAALLQTVAAELRRLEHSHSRID